MPQIFITSLCIILLSLKVLSQTSLNDSLLLYELQYFNTSNDSIKQQIVSEKINLYLRHNITDERVINEIRRTKINFFENSQQQNFFWNAGILMYLNSDELSAQHYLSMYHKISGDTSTVFHLASALAVKQYDTVKFNRHLQILSKRDSSFSSLNCFLNLYNYNRKHINFYLVSSALLPGSGTIMNGYPLKGILSLALAAGSAYGVVSLIENALYFNAFFWGSGVGLKLYAGNIKLTETSFYKREELHKSKIAKACADNLKDVLIKYPLLYK
jgi:hypothetical protein